MRDTKLRISRPRRTPDGRGGSHETLDIASGLAIWTDATVHDGELHLSVHAGEDIRVGDIVEVPFALTIGGN